MLKKIGIVVLLLVAGIALQAQTYNPYNRRGLIRKGQTLSVHSINLTGGLYAPKMDYWNNEYLPDSGSTEEFGSSMVFGGNITFKLLSQFRARVGVSYWSDKAKGSETGLKELKVSFTRLSLGGLYAPEFASFGNFQAYTGVELYLYDINNKLVVSSGLSSEDQNGHDFSYAPVLGLEASVGDHFVIGAEFSYMLGDYIQSVTNASTKKTVSIAGPQVSFSIGYKFSSFKHF